MTKRQMYIKLVVSSLIRRKARMIVALLAVAIGATIMSGLVTIYYDIPRQLGKEFRSYGANFVVLPSGNEKITDTEFDKIKNEMSTQKVVGMADVYKRQGTNYGNSICFFNYFSFSYFYWIF